MAVATNPQRLRRQLSYTAGIEYRRIGSMYCYQVSSSFRSLRTLPALDPLEVAFCRTNAALEEEFRRPATISLELCDFDDDSWWDIVADRIASVVHVDGVECPQVGVERHTDVIRLSYDVTRLDRTSHLPVQIRNTYLIPASSRLYPIVIGDYFCAGPVEMSVTLIDPRAKDLDVFVYLSNGEPWGPSGTGRHRWSRWSDS